MTPLSSLVGLAIALGGVALLVSPMSRRLGDPLRLGTKLREQLALWVLFAGVVAVVVGWEQQPLSALGVRPFGAATVGRALALAAALIWLLAPLARALVARLGLATFETGVAEFARWPLWWKLWAVLGAGVVEETLFRGFAFERLALLTGSDALAVLLVGVGFALVHGPVWGRGAVLALLVTGGAMTLFYAWQRDLFANIAAHVIVDAVGLILAPISAAATTSTPGSAAPRSAG